MPVELVCKHCGMGFSVYPSRAEQQYCSRKCYGLAQTSLCDGVRTCTSCGTAYPATTEYFYTSSSQSGLSSECRSCLRKRGKELGQRRKERNLENNRLYRAKNKDRVREWKKASYLRNREKAIATVRAYRAANAEKLRVSPEKERMKTLRRNERRRNAAGTFTKGDIERRLIEQSGRCFYCECELVNYHTDHYIPLSHGGTNMPSNIVLACPQCNLEKGEMMPDEFFTTYLPMSIKLRKVER